MTKDDSLVGIELLPPTMYNISLKRLTAKTTAAHAIKKNRR